MSEEVRSYLYDELVLENFNLQEENRKLRNAAFEICDKFVAPDFYSSARDVIEKIYNKE